MLSDGYKIDEWVNFGSFLYGAAFTPGNLIYNNITAVPSNADVKAEYTFDITVNQMLPSGTIIDVVFPNTNYKSLPSNPRCEISGGVKYFS